MGELSSHWVNEPADGDCRRAPEFERGEIVSRPGGPSAAGLVWAVALLLPAAMPAPKAVAQDEPPKVEAPRPAPPTAPADTTQRPEPPPPDAQKKDSPPDEQQKSAPTAPADTQKPAPEAPADAPKPAAARGRRRGPRSTARRGRGSQHQVQIRRAIRRRRQSAAPQLITQYRVGVLETTKYVTEKAQARPSAPRGAAPPSTPSARPPPTGLASQPT